MKKKTEFTYALKINSKRCITNEAPHCTELMRFWHYISSASFLKLGAYDDVPARKQLWRCESVRRDLDLDLLTFIVENTDSPRYVEPKQDFILHAAFFKDANCFPSTRFQEFASVA